MSIKNSTVDRLISWIAVCGVIAGLAMAIVIASVIRRNRLAIPWYDLLYFAPLNCVGLYSLLSFLKVNRKGR